MRKSFNTLLALICVLGINVYGQTYTTLTGGYSKASLTEIQGLDLHTFSLSVSLSSWFDNDIYVSGGVAYSDSRSEDNFGGVILDTGGNTQSASFAVGRRFWNITPFARVSYSQSEAEVQIRFDDIVESTSDTLSGEDYGIGGIFEYAGTEYSLEVHGLKDMDNGVILTVGMTYQLSNSHGIRVSFATLTGSENDIEESGFFVGWRRYF